MNARWFCRYTGGGGSGDDIRGAFLSLTNVRRLVQDIQVIVLFSVHIVRNMEMEYGGKRWLQTKAGLAYYLLTYLLT